MGKGLVVRRRVVVVVAMVVVEAHGVCGGRERREGMLSLWWEDEDEDEERRRWMWIWRVERANERALNTNLEGTETETGDTGAEKLQEKERGRARR